MKDKSDEILIFLPSLHLESNPLIFSRSNNLQGTVYFSWLMQDNLKELQTV